MPSTHTGRLTPTSTPLIIRPQMRRVSILTKIRIQTNRMISQHMQLTAQRIKFRFHVLKFIVCGAVLFFQFFSTAFVMAVLWTNQYQISYIKAPRHS